MKDMKSGIGKKVYWILAGIYLVIAIYCYVGDKSSLGPMWACFAFSMFCLGLSTDNEDKKDNVENKNDKDESEDE